MAGRGAVVVCVHLPHFELTVAAGGSQTLVGRALAVVPALGGAPVVGEVSGTAEAAGVLAGMTVAEALARCPQLELVAGDPLAVAREWERLACALEGIGAAVELERPGTAHFDARGLLGLHRGLDGVIAVVRRALGRPARIGVGPTRFCALAAAHQARVSRAVVVTAAQAPRHLAAQPVRLLAFREQTAALVGPLERLGIRTLGEMAALGAGPISDRFGPAGRLARELARGHDAPLAPRQARDRLEEVVELDESSSWEALECALDLLLDRLLTRPERRGRPVRAMALHARLAERGTWRERVVFREPLQDRRRMRMALALRLSSLPGPASELGLAIERLGEVVADQPSLFDGARGERQVRLRESVGQLRALAGPEAALRLIPVDPRSRVPERRFGFTPYAP